jgi:hypothetical protein
MLTCRPLPFSQNIYWLDTTITDIQSQVSIYSNIYLVDYDLLHRCFRHPFKDILSRARSKTKGFPKDLSIPKDELVCPRCAQGKMLASSHPPFETKVKAAFEHIHSNLKSIPVESYHKYKYFVSFLDNFTSFVWIVLL